MTTRAEAYCELALYGIKLSRSANSLRGWWADETAHREQYELSQQQIDMLADACRDHIRELGEIAKERPEQPAPKRKPKARQLPLI
ncbi:hypothetical protein [Bradyrhizobium sp. SZCCHNS3053]|uniref:hypothetical protein n=1 Tax=Bradyrhizobium sp. SZCCHNS3053 TaxID=3057322 RepID=UPI0029167152|nr:hypothetical protein [Bradyrhizobium sp. SZCCHNS3053]